MEKVIEERKPSENLEVLSPQPLDHKVCGLPGPLSLLSLARHNFSQNQFYRVLNYARKYLLGTTLNYRSVTGGCRSLAYKASGSPGRILTQIKVTCVSVVPD